MKAKGSLIALAGAVALPAATHAAFVSGLVGVDFNTGVSPTATGAAVVGSASDHWNGEIASTSQATPQSLVLAGDGTTASGATVTWVDNGAYYRTGTTTNPNTELLADYAYISPGSTGTVVIGGLSSGTTYNLYLYAGVDAKLNFNNNTQPTPRQTDYTVVGATTSNGSVITSGTQNSWISGQNYLAFTLAPDASGNITVTIAGDTAVGSGEGDLGGFQITPTPEPASLGLLGAAAVGLIARRRRA